MAAKRTRRKKWPKIVIERPATAAEMLDALKVTERERRIGHAVFLKTARTSRSARKRATPRAAAK